MRVNNTKNKSHNFKITNLSRRNFQNLICHNIKPCKHVLTVGNLYIFKEHGKVLLVTITANYCIFN